MVFLPQFGLQKAFGNQPCVSPLDVSNHCIGHTYSQNRGYYIKECRRTSWKRRHLLSCRLVSLLAKLCRWQADVRYQSTDHVLRTDQGSLFLPKTPRWRRSVVWRSLRHQRARTELKSSKRVIDSLESALVPMRFGSAFRC